MARMLSRSRSFRMLRGGHKDMHPREAAEPTPQPTLSPADATRLKALPPFTRAESRVETPDPEMLQRPRTSSGPGDRSTLFHKKVSPIQHPEDHGFQLSYVSPTKSATVLYTAEVLEDQEGIIGIALGSPTMAPQHWNNPPYSTDFGTQKHGNITEISSNNHSPRAFPQATANNEEARKPKISRWKSLFKKTAPPPRSQDKDSFYELVTAVTSTRFRSSQDNGSVDSGSFVQQPEVADARPSPTYTFKPDIRQSRMVPKGYPQPAIDTRPRALTTGATPASISKPPLSRFALDPTPHSASDSPVAVPALTLSGASQPTSPRRTDDKPLLDVDIPSVHMERYSVMFSGLLQQQATSTSSSLLQRRQGNSDKPKPLNALSTKNDERQSREGPLQRRATSPNLPSKSPSAHLSLFPSANTSRTPSPRPLPVMGPRALQRSKTESASSSVQQTSPPRAQKRSVPSQSFTRRTRQQPDYADVPSLSRTSSPASELSFDSDTESITTVATPIAVPRSLKLPIQDNEPVWEIIQKKPSMNTVTKASALQSHPTSGSQPSPAIKEPLSASRSPGLGRTRSHAALSPSPRSATRFENTTQATVGVARSVSVSRATKPDRLLSPHTALAGSPGDNLSPSRFIDNKPLTPTLVELKSRRSQRVQLVEA